jgi:geranylgeranyl diphosphate/geranylgeranyl-bacteriochlorophyllide a reductase
MNIFFIIFIIFYIIIGTVVNRPAIKKYQKAMRDRCAAKIEGGKIIKVEAHPIPEHMRPRRVVKNAALVGDAAGYVTKCSGKYLQYDLLLNSIY